MAENLIKRTRKDADLKLMPHDTSRVTIDNMIIKKYALKVFSTDKDSEEVLEGFIEVLTTPLPPESNTSTTETFKVIPFQHHAIDQDGLTEIITHQKKTFLYTTVDLSVVNNGQYNDILRANIPNEKKNETITNMVMMARHAKNTYFFDYVEVG